MAMAFSDPLVIKGTAYPVHVKSRTDNTDDPRQQDLELEFTVTVANVCVRGYCFITLGSDVLDHVQWKTDTSALPTETLLNPIPVQLNIACQATLFGGLTLGVDKLQFEGCDSWIEPRNLGEVKMH